LKWQRFSGDVSKSISECFPVDRAAIEWPVADEAIPDRTPAVVSRGFDKSQMKDFKQQWNSQFVPILRAV
jgi:hypothetical protein